MGRHFTLRKILPAFWLSITSLALAQAPPLVPVSELGLRAPLGFRVTLYADERLANDIYAMTLDALSGGRFRLGLGVSGPQVVEGWHGQPFGKPLTKTREYVEVVRAISDGTNNAEIAASLRISEGTVKSHVASILRKHDLRDRAQVVVVAFRSGLVAPGEPSSRDG